MAVTTANEIARNIGFSVVTNAETAYTLFTGLTLGPGTYYLTINVRSTNECGTWNTPGSPSTTTAPGVTTGPGGFILGGVTIPIVGDQFTGQGVSSRGRAARLGINVGGYPPASSFTGG